MRGLAEANRASQARRFSGSNEQKEKKGDPAAAMLSLDWSGLACGATALLCVLYCWTPSVTCPVASTTTGTNAADGLTGRTCDER